jgi:hypothetical protein
MRVTIPRPDDAWGVDFARADGTGGFVRLLRVGDRCWYWAYLVGPEIGLVVVRDHDVPVPRREGVLEVRADGLWAELVCETPDEHWGIALEAFGVALDGPAAALPGGDGAEIGVRVPVGLDLEWEVGVHAPFGSVRGEILLARDRVAFDGAGVLRLAATDTAVWPSAWSGAWRVDGGGWVRSSSVEAAPGSGGIPEPVGAILEDGRQVALELLATAPVPLVAGAGPGGPVLVRALTRAHLESPPESPSMSGIGWAEVLRPGV